MGLHGIGCFGCVASITLFIHYLFQSFLPLLHYFPVPSWRPTFFTTSVGFLPNLFVFLQGHTQWHSFLAFFFKEFVGKVTDFYVLLLNSTALLSFFFHWSYESVHFLSLCNTYSKCLMPLTTNLRISVHSLLSYVFKVFSICSRFFCLHTFKSILYLGQHCKYHSVGCRVFWHSVNTLTLCPRNQLYRDVSFLWILL